jgi:hypothetical protein
MTCERHGDRAGERTQNESILLSCWLRFRCEECRRAYAAGVVIERGAAQMRDAAVPEESLASVLARCGLPALHPSGEKRAAARSELARALALVGLGIFITTLAQPEQIGKSLFGSPQLPGATAAGVAGFWALLGLFWYLKPAAALLLESVPGLISRRRLCLVAAVAGAALLWLLPSLSRAEPRSLTPGIGIGIGAMLALASTILGGYLVEQAQRFGASGRLGALHQAAAHLAALAAPLLGLAAGRAVAPPVAAVLLALFGITAAVLLPRQPPARPRPAGMVPQLAALAQARELWQVALLLVLVIAPSSFDAVLAKQQAAWGISADQRLHLAWIAEAATLASIVAYALLCRRTRLHSLLPAGILANTAGTLLYLAYAGPMSFGEAAAIELVNGAAAALIMVTLFDLAVRSVPRQCAYLGYAILMSVNNLAHAFSEIATASLPLGFASIIVLSAACSALALLVVPGLPAAIVNRREGDPAPGARALTVGG